MAAGQRRRDRVRSTFGSGRRRAGTVRPAMTHSGRRFAGYWLGKCQGAGCPAGGIGGLPARLVERGLLSRLKDMKLRATTTLGLANALN
jgi:hypothetical protein